MIRSFHRFRTLLPLSTLALAGCSGGGGSAPTPAPLSVSGRTPEGLTATLTQSSATVPVGGTLQYTLTLTNATAAPVSFVGAAYTVYNPGGTAAPDTPLFPGRLAVFDADGQPAYPTGAMPDIGRPTHPVTVSLEPGQSLSQAEPVPVSQLNALSSPPLGPAGRYTAVATFVTSNTPTATPPLGVTVH